MRIVAKAMRQMIVFNEVCSDSTSSGRWVNICSANLSPDGRKMEGIWMQARDGVVIISPCNSGTFEATLTETPPEGVDHLDWYHARRSEQRSAWAGRIEGGLTHDDDAFGDEVDWVEENDVEGGPAEGGLAEGAQPELADEEIQIQLGPHDALPAAQPEADAEAGGGQDSA
jgi:hypothetical protein